MKALIYTRFSPRPDAKDCDSCAKQDYRCKIFATNNSYEIIGRFWDENTSGVAIDRKYFNSMITALKPKKEKIVIIIDTPDRLARDTLVSLLLQERIEQAGGLIVYADGSPSGNTPEQKFFATIRMALSTFERDRIAYATSRGLKKRQANGEFFGKPPIGYMRPEGKGTKLVPCMPEREAVKIARDCFKIGWSAAGIAQYLQDEYSNFRGDCWKAKTVKRMARKAHKWESDPEGE